MDELWYSLESLRSLLNFENGWQTAMADAWCGLFDAICGMTIPCFQANRLILVLEPDVQRFSISTLTAVALMDGIVESLVQRYLYQATLKIKAAVSIFNYSSSTSLIARENRRRRRKGFSGDFLDLRHDPELAASSNRKIGLNRNRKKYLKKAEQASEGVRCDIQALVGITDVSLSIEILVFSLFYLHGGSFLKAQLCVCRNWFSKLH
jgi:hypothetical protein